MEYKKVHRPLPDIARELGYKAKKKKQRTKKDEPVEAAS